MKLVRLACAAVGIVLAMGATAQAGPFNPYVQGNLGVVLAGNLRAEGYDALLGPVAVTESLRQGWTASLLLGGRISSTPFSVEAEGLYLNDAIKSYDINAALGTSAGLRTSAYAGLLNLKLEDQFSAEVGGMRLAPYGAVGVGYGQNSLSILGTPYAGDGLAWQGKVGLAMNSNNRMAWDLGYRYVRLPTFDTNKLGLVARMRTDAQAVTIGVRYAFGPR